MSGQLLLFLMAAFAMAILGCLGEKVTVVEQTPVPETPEQIIGKFIAKYNERNASAVYEMLSDRLKAGYLFEDIAKEIEDAKRLDISIPEWRIVEKRKEDGKIGIKLNLSVRLKAEFRNFTTNITLVREGDGWRIDKFFAEKLWRRFLPPAQISPIPPSGILEAFVHHYNSRDAKAIYDMLSERVRKNHSLEDVIAELQFAELHNITILNAEIEEMVQPNARQMLVSLNLSNENTATMTVNFSITYVPYELKEDGWVYARGLKGKIDSWIFDEMHSK